MEENQKVVLVFGAGGIGSAIISEFLGARYKVAVADLKVAPEIVEKVQFHSEFDITDETAVDKFVADAAAELGQINAVIVNSGITKDSVLVKWPRGADGKPDKSGGPISMLRGQNPGEGMTTLAFTQVLQVHLFGAFFVSRAVMPWLIASKGSLTFTSSIVARDGNIGQTNYGAAKGALEGMMRSLSSEYKRDGVRVNAVGPGFTDTPMIAKMNETPKGAQKLAELRAAGYVIQPETIAQEFLRLAEGNESGIVSYIDGGCKI